MVKTLDPATRSRAPWRGSWLTAVVLVACESPQPRAPELSVPVRAPVSAPPPGSHPVMPTPPAAPGPPPRADAGPPPAALPTVTFIMSEQIGGDGELDTPALDATLRTLAPTLLACDERASVGGPRFQGVLEIRFRLGESGRASRVVADDHGRSHVLAVCAESALRRVPFSGPRRGSVDVLTAYRFAAR